MLTNFALILCATTFTAAQTYHRAAACPSLGCVYPPTEVDFIPGQVFDLRVEAQAPQNGSIPWTGTNNITSVLIKREAGTADYVTVEEYFKIDCPPRSSFFFFTFFSPN